MAKRRAKIVNPKTFETEPAAEMLREHGDFPTRKQRAEILKRKAR